MQVKSEGRIVSITRREFVAAGTLGAAAVAAGCTSHNGNFSFLTPDEARTLAALCDQIIPADDYPSASQAGVVTYIDLQLMRPYRRHQRAFRAGLAQAESCSVERFGAAVAATAPEQQLATVQMLEQQNRRFFELLRNTTMEGYYGSPRHGGNHDAVSWRMLGLTEPPVRGRARYSFPEKS